MNAHELAVSALVEALERAYYGGIRGKNVDLYELATTTVDRWVRKVMEEVRDGR